MRFHREDEDHDDAAVPDRSTGINAAIKDSVVVADSGVGQRFLGATGITVVAVIVLTTMTLAVYALVALWPTNSSSAATASNIVGIQIMLDQEQRLFSVVAIAGALGGLIHSSRSLYEYAGNRLLRRSWLLMYLSLPFIGAALAVVFYVILRGGLITGAAAEINFFGFAAVSALVGLFSPEAAEKLKQIFSTLLAPDPPARDSLRFDPTPVVESVEPEAGSIGTSVTIRGRHLSGTTAVIFQNAVAPATVISATEVTTIIPKGATAGTMNLLIDRMIVEASPVFRIEA
jgi:hypothetical protein